MTDHSLRYASHQDAIYAFSPMGANDDHVGGPPFGVIEDNVSRVVFLH